MALIDKLTAIANAIRNKTGKTDPMTLEQMPGEIEGIETGGGVSYSEDDDVCFWDYDGTLLYSCTLEEAQTMTELPKPPDHSLDDIPLSFEEWNWTLEEINGLDRKADIGAMYSPTDGKTHFTLNLTKKTGLTVTVNFSYAKLLTFDWGDGTVEEHTPSAGGQASHSHTYSDYGIYHCSIDPNGNGWNPGGTKSFVITDLASSEGAAVTGKLVFDSLAKWDWPGAQGIRLSDATVDTVIYPFNMTGCNASMSVGEYVKHVNQPRTHINGDVFGGVLSGGKHTERCSLPCNLTSAMDYAFSYKHRMKEIRLPKALVYFNRFAFIGCTLLEEICLDGRTSLGMREFRDTRSLVKLEIPATVTNIGAEVFMDSYILNYYFYSETPPTLENANSFQGIRNNALIHVPATSLEAYQTATNWSVYADYMVGDL